MLRHVVPVQHHHHPINGLPLPLPHQVLNPQFFLRQEKFRLILCRPNHGISHLSSFASRPSHKGTKLFKFGTFKTPKIIIVNLFRRLQLSIRWGKIHSKSSVGQDNNGLGDQLTPAHPHINEKTECIC